MLSGQLYAGNGHRRQHLRMKLTVAIDVNNIEPGPMPGVIGAGEEAGGVPLRVTEQITLRR